MCLAGAVRSLELVLDFWTRYQQVGHCVFDRQHREHFVGAERYAVSGNVGSVCGAVPIAPVPTDAEKHQQHPTPRTMGPVRLPRETLAC